MGKRFTPLSAEDWGYSGNNMANAMCAGEIRAIINKAVVKARQIGDDNPLALKRTLEKTIDEIEKVRYTIYKNPALGSKLEEQIAAFMDIPSTTEGLKKFPRFKLL